MIFYLSHRNGGSVRVWATQLIFTAYPKKLEDIEKKGLKGISQLFVMNKGKRKPQTPSTHTNADGKIITFYYAFSFKTVPIN